MAKLVKIGLYHFSNLLQPLQKPAACVSKSSVNTVVSNSVNVASTSSDSYFVWHSRLGHSSLEVLNNILKLCNLLQSIKMRKNSAPFAVLVNHTDYHLLLPLLFMMHLLT